MDKLQHTVETLDDIPESVRPFYSEGDGKFYLQVDGVVPKSRHDEFRENNISLLKENDTLKATLDTFGDLTPEKLKELKQIAESKAGGLDEKQIEDLVNDRVVKRTQKMHEDHETAIKAEREGRTAAESLVSTLLIDNGATQAAVSGGVRDSAIPDVVGRARSVFKVTEGKAVPYENGEVVYGKDGQTPLTMQEWLAERVKDCPHWFKEPKGGGSRHNSGASGANAPQGNQNLRGMARMRAARS